MGAAGDGRNMDSGGGRTGSGHVVTEYVEMDGILRGVSWDG